MGLSNDSTKTITQDNSGSKKNIDSKSSSGMAAENNKSTMNIRKITPSITTFSTTFDRFNKVRFGIRATVVQLRSGSLVVFSPVAFTPEVQSTIASTGNGQIHYIIAPDYEHHMHLGAWAHAFPAAKVIGVEGLPEKRAKPNSGVENIPFHYIFTAQNQAEIINSLPKELTDEFEIEYFPTHMNKELAFLHKPDGGTLIQADLLFNHPPIEQYSKSKIGHSQGIFTKVFHLFTGLHGNGQRRFMWYVIAAKDRNTFAKGAKKVSREWQFERIIPAHGDVVESGGKGAWDGVMKWFLEIPEKNQEGERARKGK